MSDKKFVKGWNSTFSLEDSKNLAYFERNMLAVFIGLICNDSWENHPDFDLLKCGYYVHGEWEGWSRVISLFGGQYTFHVPDEFDIGRLPLINANWDGHSTEDKWTKMMEICGMELDLTKK